MISETAFSQGFSSVWRMLTPNSERVVRKLNLATERTEVPFPSDTAPDRRAFINECGFILFMISYDDGLLRLNENDESIKEIVCRDTRNYLKKFYQLDDELLRDASKHEWKEACIIAKRLYKFINFVPGTHNPFVVSPRFAGCGFLSSCHGDLLIGTNLIEIKGVDRRFRASDIRQLLVYVALNSISTGYEIDRVGCFNPRKGLYFFVNLDTLVLELASRPTTDLLSEIVYVASSGELSR